MVQQRELPIRFPLTPSELNDVAGDTLRLTAYQYDAERPGSDLRAVLALEKEFEAAEMLYIDPDVCIQCGNCEPACPVTAIFTEETVPDKWKHFLQVNADWYKSRQT